MGHMNVMWYVGKFDEATWQLFTRLGLSPSRLHDDGIGMAAVEQHIEYKRELRAGDVVSISSHVTEVKEKSVRFVHQMRNDESAEIVATTTLVGVCINMTTRRAVPLPADLREHWQACE